MIITTIMITLTITATTTTMATPMEQKKKTKDAKPSDVVTLDAATFDDHIKAQPVTLVEFFAPWCGHCKQLVPEYEKTATALKGQASVAKVDCTEERELCNRFDVQGFPTLKLFRNDNSAPTDYELARKADAMTKFVIKQMTPAYRELKSSEELTKATESAVFVVVGFVSSDDQTSRDAFTSAAKTLRNDFDFVLVTDAALIAEKKIASLPAVMIYRNFDEPEISKTDEFTADSIGKFVTENSLPVLGVIGPENYQKYVGRALPLLWLFVNFEEHESAVSAVAEVAKQFRKSLLFAKLDGVKWADHSKNFGLSGVPPGIVIEDRDKRKNYIYPQTESITAPLLADFVQKFVDGTLKPNIKSQEPPADNSGPVKVIVGSTFESIVMDTTKDVFVEFYAPWCGHCKHLAPKYDELGAVFAGVDSVVIAKVDATENDTPIDIKGFPTLILFTAADKANPITFSGDRSVSAMEKFIREKATTLSKSSPKESPKETGNDNKEDL